MKTKKIAVIDVWIESTESSYDNVKSYQILPGGCLKFVERDGDTQIFGPSTGWSLIERVER